MVKIRQCLFTSLSLLDFSVQVVFDSEFADAIYTHKYKPTTTKFGTTYKYKRCHNLDLWTSTLVTFPSIKIPLPSSETASEQ